MFVSWVCGSAPLACLLFGRVEVHHWHVCYLGVWECATGMFVSWACGSAPLACLLGRCVGVHHWHVC